MRLKLIGATFSILSVVFAWMTLRYCEVVEVFYQSGQPRGEFEFFLARGLVSKGWFAMALILGVICLILSLGGRLKIALIVIGFSFFFSALVRGVYILPIYL